MNWQQLVEKLVSWIRDRVAAAGGKGVVVGSSNRDELALGYFTKYGDGGVDIQPLGNLLKGQVKELAQFLGIPQHIIDKSPSTGLWEGQTDEGE